MTNKELITKLLEFPLDAEIVRRAGEDPCANLDVTEITWGETYLPAGPTRSRKRTRKTLIIR